MDFMFHCRSFFFFSSRRRHTRFDCDWSSDVCSSDLHRCSQQELPEAICREQVPIAERIDAYIVTEIETKPVAPFAASVEGRSEERRVGKECRSRWSP